MSLKRLRSLMTVLLLALLLPLGFAQDQPKQKPKRNEKPQPVLAVKWNVSVTDSAGQPVNNLTEDRFRIFEDEVPQKLSSFQLRDRPPAFVLTIDCSGSLRSLFSTVLGVATLIIKHKAANEQVMIVSFISSDKIKRVQDFTSDQNTLLKGIDSMFLEGGQSAIIDALAISNDEIAAFTKGKANIHRPIIVITDGEDRRSYFTEAQLLDKLRLTGAEVQVLAFQQTLQKGRVRDKAAELLNRIAVSSGGAAYYPANIPELERDVEQMMAQMRAPYLIEYESTNSVRDGKFRKVRVEIESPSAEARLTVSARDGYLAPNK